MTTDFRIAHARLLALQEHIPDGMVFADLIILYHGILDDLASPERDLSAFRISQSAISGGRSNYSCLSPYFKIQVDGLLNLFTEKDGEYRLHAPK